MVNDGIFVYLIYKIGSFLFWPVVIIFGLLLFHPVGWLIIGVIWFLSQAYKGVEAQIAEEDAQARKAELEAPSETSG